MGKGTDGNFGWSKGKVGWWARQYIEGYAHTDYLDVKVDCYIKSNCEISYNTCNGSVERTGSDYKYTGTAAHRYPNGGTHQTLLATHTFRIYRTYKYQKIYFESKVNLSGGLRGSSTAKDYWEVAAKPVPVPTITNATLSSGKYVDLSIRSNSSDIDRQRIWRTKNNSSETKVYEGKPITSFRDTISSPGVYKYRMVNFVKDAYSEWSSWTREFTVVAIPSAPTITNVERLGTDKTKISLRLNSSSTTALYIYRQKSGSSAETTVYSGAPVTTYTDTPGVGTFRYRAKNHNTSGNSEYSSWSQWVSTLKPPNAPTITAPVSSAVITATGPIKFQWRHNPVDGSSQTSAEVKIWGTKSSAVTHTVRGSADSLTIADLTSNQDVSFQVRTKGSHSDYSPWSAVRNFKYLAPISASIRPIEVVKKFPISISWVYEDGYGTQASAVVKIMQDGRILATKSVDNEDTAVFDKDSFSIKDSTRYAVSVAVRSTSGMTDETTSYFNTALSIPGTPTADISADNTSAAVSITPQATSGDVATESFTILRNGKIIFENLIDGTTVSDSTAPIDVPLEYEIRAISEAGTYASVTKTERLVSGGFAFINFEEGFEDMARLAMDLKLSEKVEIDKTMMVTPSRRFPVVIYGENETVTGSLSAKTWWLEDMSQDGQKAMCAQFEKLARYKGVCVLRLPHQETKFVILNVSINKGEAYNLAGISIDYQEVDGSGLD